MKELSDLLIAFRNLFRMLFDPFRRIFFGPITSPRTVNMLLIFGSLFVFISCCFFCYSLEMLTRFLEPVQEKVYIIDIPYFFRIGIGIPITDDPNVHAFRIFLVDYPEWEYKGYTRQEYEEHRELFKKIHREMEAALNYRERLGDPWYRFR